METNAPAEQGPTPSSTFGPDNVAELDTRFTAVQKASGLAPPNNVLWTNLRSKNLVMEDGSWPYLKWDPAKNQMVQNVDKPTVSTGVMQQHLLAAVEMLREPHHIIKFQAMGVPPQGQTAPWKLQLNLRYNYSPSFAPMRS